ncbi:MAG TPA: ABC transporter ATP-binding protein [Chitinispirillaceae bacterium]|nr:ABC transporter ATP-binding protein [Chitinispirillaceae bacterium]
MIILKDVEKIYYTEEVETTALDKICLEIHKGEFVAITGPSGCGKSTLLNIIGLLDVPNKGQHWFMDEEVSRITERKRIFLRKSNIGFIFQSFHLIGELTVYENVELSLLYIGIPSGERKKRVEEALEKTGIAHRRNHFPQQLSGGQQQRVAVARAVAANPKLILADEPTGNLDTTHGLEIMALLHDLHRNGTTIVMVTHTPEFARQAQRIISLCDGHILN